MCPSHATNLQAEAKKSYDFSAIKEADEVGTRDCQTCTQFSCVPEQTQKRCVSRDLGPACMHACVCLFTSLGLTSSQPLLPL